MMNWEAELEGGAQELEGGAQELDDSYHGDVLPWLVPTGCDVFLADHNVQYRWLRVDSLWYEDDPEEAATDHVGREDGHVEQVSDFGWAQVLDVDLRDRDAWVDFLAREGVAPGQPFLVRVGFTYTTDYWGEHDCDIDAKVVAVEPWARSCVLAAWDAGMLGRAELAALEQA